MGARVKGHPIDRRFAKRVFGCLTVTIPLLAAIQACSGESRPTGPSVPLTPPTSASDLRIAAYRDSAYQASQGARYFGWYGCQACHAADSGRNDLRKSTRRHGGTFDATYAFIRHGHPPELDVNADRIPTEQLWQITAYVASLATLDQEKRRRQDADSVAEAQASQPPRPRR